MQKWEYLNASVSVDRRPSIPKLSRQRTWHFSDGRPDHVEDMQGDDGYVATLNRLGDEGWRLVRTLTNEMLFMRPKD